MAHRLDMIRRVIRPAAILLGCVLALAISTRVDAGAWTQAQGHGYYEISAAMLRGDDYRDREGHPTQIPTLAEYTLGAYVEYGLRDDLTLVAYLPMFKRITLNEQLGRESDFVYFGGDAVHGIADAELGLRYRLLDSDVGVLSAALRLGLPIGDDTQTNGLLTGDGEFNQQVALLFGRSLYPWPGHLGLEIAYNLRHDGYDDDVSVTAEGGTRWRRLSLGLRTQWLSSRDNGDDAVSGGAGGLYGNHRRYISFGPRVGLRLSHDLELSVSGTMVRRLRNGIATPAFGISLSTQR
ncbi:MAG: hypothetical protein HN712_27975 [Gemmatimonadetes bacterium]|jgi:hypothetical protein|nr:hypothetical protein [Gemmatimonadota bacterium]MBT6149171.1 hypothetical protein [Gemmatimonadota bacterium]MBT7864181.1 hypothetical protein [Gemmatimonadota bacterium]